MAGMCCGVVGETEIQSTVEPSGGRQARRRQMEIHQLKFLASDVVAPPPESGKKRRRLESLVQPCVKKRVGCSSVTNPCISSSDPVIKTVDDEVESRFGVTTVCGRRRDMEDAVAVKPSFNRDLNFYGVYDGHGISHVTLLTDRKC
ncbi:hypothetical protein R6Q59_021291 [Mikania micrantha]